MTGSRSFKIGILVIVSVVGLVLAALALGVKALKQPTVAYYTYFDESVQGLDVGSPVKFRGVTIGNVSRIGIAPDRRKIAVTLGLHADKLRDFEVTPAMRAQLSTTGITGVKFIDLDLTDPVAHPPPPLSFTPPENYIPSQPSMLGQLAQNLEDLGPRIPELIDRTMASLDKVDLFVQALNDERVPQKLGGVIANVEKISHQAERARIPTKLATTIDKLNTSIAKLGRIADRFDGDGGLIAGARRAIDTLTGFGRSAKGSTDELGQTIRDLGEAARSVSALADAIEQDPDMLVKGRARKAPR